MKLIALILICLSSAFASDELIELANLRTKNLNKLYLRYKYLKEVFLEKVLRNFAWPMSEAGRYSRSSFLMTRHSYRRSRRETT